MVTTTHDPGQRSPATKPASISPQVRARLQQMQTVQVWSSDPDVLTVAKVRRWSRTAAYRAVHDGRLPVIKISPGRYAVSTEVLLRIIDAPPVARGECEVCGTPLIGRNSRTKYCSSRCCMRAYHKRMAAA